MTRFVSVVTPCRNEEENVRALYEAVKEEFAKLPQYSYEHIFIDNASEDRTVAILREITAEDKNVKVIVNLRNFGSNTGLHAFRQISGEALIPIACDFQDPVEYIPRFLQKWEEGWPIVASVKNQTTENFPMAFVRKTYYYLIDRISETKQIRNFTGFGIYDRKVIDCLRSFHDARPVFRSMIAELGFPMTTMEFVQPKRQRGKSSWSLYELFDFAMVGFVNYSLVPVRLATFTGFGAAFCSLCVALFYLVYKLRNWDTFNAGMAPLVLGLFFFSAVQLIFLGFLGEYVGAILTQVKNRPLVIEKERINFPETESKST